MKKLKEKLKKNKHYKFIMRNFKFPVFTAVAGALILGYGKFSKMQFIPESQQSKVFLGSLLVAFLVIFKSIGDILSVVFGEREKGSFIKNEKGA